MDSTALADNNDSRDAMVFIIVVIIWYSFAHVFLLLDRINEDESIESTMKLFRSQNPEHDHQKQILQELVNKNRREKLWKIYFGEKSLISDQMHRAEIFRIRNIERQLSINSNNDETDSHRLDRTDQSLFMNNQRFRRRSSIDYQIINEWKTVSDQLKRHDVWPWTVRRHLIRNHFRRQRFQSESIDSKYEQS